MQGHVVVLPPTRAVDPDTELAGADQLAPSSGSALCAASQAEEGSAPGAVSAQKASPGLMSSSAQGGGSACKPRTWRLLPAVLALVFLLAIMLPLLGRARSLHWQDSLTEKSTRTLLVFKQVRYHPLVTAYLPTL